MPKKLTVQEAVQKLESLADSHGESFSNSYSGRFMFGKTCPSITTDDVTAVIEDAAELGIRGAKTDNMGRSYVVYWPQYDTSKKEELCQTESPK